MRKVSKTGTNTSPIVFVSLFYAEHGWHRLISEAVLPLLANVEAVCKMKVLLHFTRWRGNNAGLTLVPCGLLVPALIDEFDTGMRQFFRDYPSETQPARNGPADLFMNFPNNSAQYGVHKFLLRAPAALHMPFLRFADQASRVMMHDFCTRPFDGEDLFMACLYLNLAAALHSSALAEVYSRQVISHADKIKFGRDYRQNEAALLGVLEDCRRTLAGEALPGLLWMKNWLAGFSLLAKQPGITVQGLHYALAVTRCQFGLNEDGSTMIDHFLQQLLKTQTASPAVSARRGP